MRDQFIDQYNWMKENILKRKNYIQFISHQLGVPNSIISIGPRRNQIIHIET